MDKLNAIAAFVKIVDSGSITAAAEAMDVSQPSMVRTLAGLERSLGTRLINRTTRRMALTDEGRDYYERGRQILAAVEEAELSLTARQVNPRGRLRIASSVSFGRTFVAPVVAAFQKEHRELTVELILLDRVVDLLEEGMDLAIRVARLADSSMIAHPIGEVRRVVVASPSVARGVSKVSVPDDLRERDCVTFTGVTSPSQWEFIDGRKSVHVRVRSRFLTNQVDAGVHACVQGLGYGCFLDYHVQHEINARRLTRVLSAFEQPPIPANVVYPSSRQQSPNVRSFVQFALPKLRELLAAAQHHR